MTIDKFNKQLSRPNPDGRFLDKAITNALSPESYKVLRRKANMSMVQFAHNHLSADEFYAMIPRSPWFITSITHKDIRISAFAESKHNKVERYATYKFVSGVTACSLSIKRELRGNSVNFSVMEVTRDGRPDLVFVEIKIPSKTHNGSKVYLYKREDGVVEVEFAGIDNQRSRTDSPQAIKDAKRYFKNIDFDILRTDTKYQDKIFKVFQEFAIFEKIDDLLKK